MPPLWESALEAQFNAVKLSRISVNVLRENPDKFGGTIRHDLIKVDENVVKFLPRATAFAWHKELTRAVWESSASIPGDAMVTADLLPESGPRAIAWWWFEWPLPAVNSVRYPDTETVRGLMLVQDETGIVVIEFRDGGQEIPLIPGVRFFIPRGRTLDQLDHFDPDDASNDVGIRGLSTSAGDTLPQMRRMGRFVLAACVFLRQRIVQSSDVHIERHLRKRIQREHPDVMPSVKLIALRRAESSQHDGGDTRQVEWSCQWIVQGHWRNQKIKEGHRLIYIEKYIKGPEDKPLRVHPQTVFDVKR